MRTSLSLALLLALAAAPALAQLAGSSASTAAQLPDAPSATLLAASAQPADLPASTPAFSSSLRPADLSDEVLYSVDPQQDSAQAARQSDRRRTPPPPPVELDKNGNPIPIERQQPKRILGFMPNFRSVSNGAVPPPPTFKNNFRIATHQAFDYSSFIFLGITSLSAEGINSHPALGKGVGGFWSYTWRGFLDKTDGTYLSAWLLPSILREDTRYYALGQGHSIPIRVLYVISRQGVARTYGGRQTPNIAGLGGKVLTQVISRNYYPTSATSFSVLATKFGYSAMRDVAFSSIREFYPDIAAHYVRKHRAKIAAAADKAAQAAAGQSSSPTPSH